MENGLSHEPYSKQFRNKNCIRRYEPNDAAVAVEVVDRIHEKLIWIKSEPSSKARMANDDAREGQRCQINLSGGGNSCQINSSGGN